MKIERFSELNKFTNLRLSVSPFGGGLRGRKKRIFMN
jgi:hypothetical protein